MAPSTPLARSFIVAQGRHEGNRLPRSKWHSADHPGASRSTPLTRAKFVLTAVSSMNTSRWNQAYLVLGSNVGVLAPHPLAAVRRLAGFFLSVISCDRENAKASYGWCESSLAQLCDGLHQSQVWLLGDQIEYLLRNCLQRRNASHEASAQRSCFRASAAPTLSPNSRSPRNVQPSRAVMHRFQQLRLRVPVDHQNRTSASPTPANKNQCTQIRSLLTLWESRRFKSGGTALA